MYVPEGYGTVFPYMIADDAEGFADFLSKVFGANEIGRTVIPNGRIANIRVRIGTSAFMISQSGDGGMKAMAGAYYVYVEDVDGTFEKALAAGAQKIIEPTDMAYLDRQAGVSDPSGNIWWISRRLVEESYD